jgi:hypothetical protein
MANMDAGLSRVEKRIRPPVSCEPCRTRKYAIAVSYLLSQTKHAHRLHNYRLKCNRALPCDTCTRRGKSSLCSFAPNANRNKHEPSKARELKDRLSTLENLVSSLLSGDAVIQPGLFSESEPSTKDSMIVVSSVGQSSRPATQASTFSISSGKEDALTPEIPHIQETGTGQVNYIDPSHWLSILDDIKEVREHLSIPTQPIFSNGTAFDLDRTVSDAGVLLCSGQNPSFDEILRSLPSQPICDTLVSWYFNSKFMILGKKKSVIN